MVCELLGCIYLSKLFERCINSLNKCEERYINSSRHITSLSNCDKGIQMVWVKMSEWVSHGTSFCPVLSVLCSNILLTGSTEPVQEGCWSVRGLLSNFIIIELLKSLLFSELLKLSYVLVLGLNMMLIWQVVLLALFDSLTWCFQHCLTHWLDMWILICCCWIIGLFMIWCGNWGVDGFENISLYALEIFTAFLFS